MQFNYYQKTFIGTRSEIIGKLKAYIYGLPVYWNNGCRQWEQGTEILCSSCGPDHAKSMFFNRAVNRVPKNTIFNGIRFNDTEELREHLETWEVRHLGYNRFVLYDHVMVSRVNLTLSEIKERMIKEIIDEV